MMTLGQAHDMLPGSTLVGDPQTLLQRVHTDTRSLQPGDFFVALRGEHFDAHDFLPQAKAGGAVAALAQRGLVEAGLPGLLVPDTTAALGELAAAWRARFDLALIAVTGSNGKTTVTQMIGAILRAGAGGRALVTEGNFNNHIGLPLTLLRLREHDGRPHVVAAVELGMNHPGEIARLARIAAPSVALVNNAQREHQEFMHSVEAVARENGSVLSALGPAGIAVFPADDAQAPVWREMAGERPVMTYAYGAPTPSTPDAAWPDVWADAAWVGDHWIVQAHTNAGGLVLSVHAPGLHNVRNALAAVTCALAVGAPINTIREGIARFRPVSGRSQTHRMTLDGRPVTVVDDSYNANPDSVRAAIDLLAGLPGPRWLVLGDMGEVGEHGIDFHREVGAHAARSAIDHLWTAGPLATHAAQAFGTGARHHADVDDLLAALGERPLCASVLVKGSRFMRMERVVRALWEAAAPSEPDDTLPQEDDHAG